MPRAIIYCRVSTAGQAESGAGLGAQEDAARRHAERAGLGVLGPFADEGVGGATPLDGRPALIEALAHFTPGDVLLVAKRDRLGRDPIVVAVIEAAVAKRGGRVVSCAGEGTEGDDPASILMRRVIDAVAEHERLINKVRTRSALLAKRLRGERTGSVPFGYALVDDGRRSKTEQPVALVADPAEQATVALIRDLHDAGWPLRRIAAELGRRGIPPKKGGASWSTGSLARILERSPTPIGATPDHAPAP